MIIKRTLLYVALSAFLLMPVSQTQAETLSVQELQRKINGLGMKWEARETTVSKMFLEGENLPLGKLPPTEQSLSSYNDGMPKAFIPKKALPSSLDWRDYGGTSYVTPIRNQAPCDNCWAFAFVGALESLVLIEQSLELDLSEQHLTSCNEQEYTCHSGGDYPAAQYFVDFGAVLESQMPYVGWDAPCPVGSFVPSAAIDSWSRFTGIATGLNPDYPFVVNNPVYYLPTNAQIDNEAIKTALQTAPVWVGMVIFNDFLSYGSGVYECTICAPIDLSDIAGYHAVIIVGYDDDAVTSQDPGAWIVKNSWGTGWGDSGFFQIAYHEALIGWDSVALLNSSVPKNQYIPTITSGPEVQHDVLNYNDKTTVSVTAVDDDPWDSTLNYSWITQEGCGIFLDNKRSSTYFTAASVTEITECDLQVTVSDIAGEKTSGSVKVTVNPNFAPTAEIIADKLSGQAPLTVNFEADASDANGDPMTYKWDFGDSQTSEERECRHTFTSQKTYDISLTVTDNGGESTTVKGQIIAHGAGGCGLQEGVESRADKYMFLMTLLMISLGLFIRGKSKI